MSEVERMFEEFVDSHLTDRTYIGPINRTRAVEALTALVAQAQTEFREECAEGWRTVESCPKDKTHVLGYFGTTGGDEYPDQMVVCYDAKINGWYEPTFPNTLVDVPTHWQPLPLPPSEAGS